MGKDAPVRWWAGRPAALIALLTLGATARAQEVTAPPPTPPTVAAPLPPSANARANPSSADLVERFNRLEAMNQKLLEEVGRLSRENKTLSDRVRNLDQKVGDGKSEEKKDDAKSKSAAKKKDSGIANPLVEEVVGSDGIGVGGDTRSESGERSGGLRLLPEAQIVGNRKLGKIPLRPYLDYGRAGVGFETEDQEFQLKTRVELQADARLYLGSPGSDTHSGFYLPRTRFYLHWHFTRPIDYQLSFQRSFSSFNVLNAFLNFNYFDEKVQFRIGRFKAPYTYEWYKVNNWRLITPERSLFAANFGLNRMLGAMLWGELAEQRIEYAASILDGPRNSFEDFNAAKDIVAFVNFLPFIQTDSILKFLNIGGSVDYGRQDNSITPAALRTNTNGSSATISPTDTNSNATVPFLAFNKGVTETGPRELWELHLAYYYQGLSLYAAWDQGINSFAVPKLQPVRLPVGGWNVTAAYLITGETLSERTVVDPIRRFDLRRGRFGLGAIEPFARYSELTVGNQVFTFGLADPNLWTNRAQLVDVGANWYLNKAIRVVFDWEHAMFAQPVFLNNSGGFQKTNDLLWLRVQIYY